MVPALVSHIVHFIDTCPFVRVFYTIAMQSIRVPYKHDIFGNPIFARVTWSGVDLFPKPTGTSDVVRI